MDASAAQKTYRVSDDPAFLTNQEKNHIYRVQHKRQVLPPPPYIRRASPGGGALLLQQEEVAAAAWCPLHPAE
jgi:hypothetical protein